MDIRVELYLQFDIQLQQALFQFVELLSDIGQLSLVVVAGDQAAFSTVSQKRTKF